ncbi:hypothetical protein VNO77_19318 [Canavalia gladiata]|uniref:Uncharacterized protein n=1 Tax=Canavalia gladiata TaxID=3824 RepID=A0AAN9LRB7_CANGL
MVINRLDLNIDPIRIRFQASYTKRFGSHQNHYLLPRRDTTSVDVAGPEALPYPSHAIASITSESGSSLSPPLSLRRCLHLDQARLVLGVCGLFYGCGALSNRWSRRTWAEESDLSMSLCALVRVYVKPSAIVSFAHLRGDHRSSIILAACTTFAIGHGSKPITHKSHAVGNPIDDVER